MAATETNCVSVCWFAMLCEVISEFVKNSQDREYVVELSSRQEVVSHQEGPGTAILGQYLLTLSLTDRSCIPTVAHTHSMSKM